MDRHRDPTARAPAPVPAALLTLLGASLREAAAAGRTREARRGRPAARPARFGDFSVTGRSVTIRRPRAEVYAFFGDPSNLARCLENVVLAEERDGITRWTIRTAGGRTARLETVIVEDRPGEQIAWRSVDGADIRIEGKVMFRDAAAGKGTVLTAIVAWIPPTGELGRYLAGSWRRNPAAQTRHELNRLRMVLEMGATATVRAPD